MLLERAKYKFQFINIQWTSIRLKIFSKLVKDYVIIVYTCWDAVMKYDGMQARLGKKEQL